MVLGLAHRNVPVSPINRYFVEVMFRMKYLVSYYVSYYVRSSETCAAPLLIPWDDSFGDYDLKTYVQ